MKIDRRRFLTVLGLGGLSTIPSLGWNAIAGADEGPPPKRLLLYITAHGTVPNAWRLPMPGMPADRVANADLTVRAAEELPQILRPLHPHLRKLLCVEGLAQSTVLAEHAYVESAPRARRQLARARTGPSPDGPARASGAGRGLPRRRNLRRPGHRTAHARGWALGVARLRREPLPALLVHCRGRRCPAHRDRGASLRRPRGHRAADLGHHLARGSRPGGTRKRPRPRRGRVRVRSQAPRSRRTAQARATRRARARFLEVRFSSAALAPRCELELDPSGHAVDVWNRLLALVLACDVSRVVTFVVPILDPPDFGYPPEPSVHDGYAHSSVVDDGAQPFEPRAEEAMIAYNEWYSNRFADLLALLDSMPEGTGTLLDHSNVVWLTELATGTHEHTNLPIVIAGGGDGFFRTGAYVRYPQLAPSPWTPPRPAVSRAGAQSAPRDAHARDGPRGRDVRLDGDHAGRRQHPVAPWGASRAPRLIRSAPGRIAQGASARAMWARTWRAGSSARRARSASSASRVPMRLSASTAPSRTTADRCAR